MERIHGRPETDVGRLPKEIRVYDLLDSLGVSYERVDHEPAMTMAVCAAIDHVLEAPTCKNLLLCNRQATAFYLLMLPGNKAFKTSALSRQIGSSRLSFADQDAMVQLLDITPGSVSVMGLMNDRDNRVQLLIDRELLQEVYIGCHPCINTTSLRFLTRDLLGKILPAVHHTPIFVDLPWLT